MSIEFKPWPKIARLRRPVTITEKIDGTNAAVVIERRETSTFIGDPLYTNFKHVFMLGGQDGEDVIYEVAAQSRKRIITPDDDNFGFARWVWDNASDLVRVLGEGRHFGEWWGSGIQRGYGLKNGEKRFSLFNTTRWTDEFGNTDSSLFDIEGLDIVPIFVRDADFNDALIYDALDFFDQEGSLAAPGFKPVEGIVVFHTASNTPFKVTLIGDEKPKGSNE